MDPSIRPLISSSSSACSSPLKCSVGPSTDTRSEALSYGLDIVSTPPTGIPEFAVARARGKRVIALQPAPASVPARAELDAMRVTHCRVCSLRVHEGYENEPRASDISCEAPGRAPAERGVECPSDQEALPSRE